VRLSLWRAVSLFRIASSAVAVFLITRWQPLYERPGVAATAAATMIVVTAAIAWLAVLGQAHRVSVVIADAVVTAGLTLLTMPAQTAEQQHGGMVTLTTIWGAGPTIEAAFLAGPVGGVAAALVQYGVTACIAQTTEGRTLYSGVLLLLTGLVVGYVARLAVRAEADLRTAAAAQAALAERERLARSIHDGVLQLLGLLARRADDVLANEARKQEAALRGLITSRPTADGAAATDLASELRTLRSETVTVSTPDRVLVARHLARELRDAVGAAVQNVALHAGPGAHAWVLLEEEDATLRVTVRDDGVGIAAGRLAEAERAGRLGVARSIRGRVADLGGRCRITSTPGAGTTIEMSVPL
jgi:signal transduction histidine kinase